MRMCVFDSGDVGAQQVFMVHANGFHARCWDKVAESLPEHWHVIAVDLRGHGRSDKAPPYTWQKFANDLLGCAEHFNVSGAVGVGHSLGGHCVTHICALRPELFSRLVLVDPVIFRPEMYGPDHPGMVDRVEDHPVARRRAHFESWQDMYERYKDRGSYPLWKDEIFRDYCEFGVAPSADGSGVDLACPPMVEATIYMHHFDVDLYAMMPDIEQPVAVLRAKERDEDAGEMDFSASPTAPDLAEVFPNGEDVYLPHLTHFIPMQDPELVARYIENENI